MTCMQDLGYLGHRLLPVTPPFSAVSAHPGYICRHASTSLDNARIDVMEGMQ